MANRLMCVSHPPIWMRPRYRISKLPPEPAEALPFNYWGVLRLKWLPAKIIKLIHSNQHQSIAEMMANRLMCVSHPPIWMRPRYRISKLPPQPAEAPISGTRPVTWPLDFHAIGRLNWNGNRAIFTKFFPKTLTWCDVGRYAYHYSY